MARPCSSPAKKVDPLRVGAKPHHLAEAEQMDTLRLTMGTRENDGRHFHGTVGTPMKVGNPVWFFTIKLGGSFTVNFPIIQFYDTGVGKYVRF